MQTIILTMHVLTMKACAKEQVFLSNVYIVQINHIIISRLSQFGVGIVSRGHVDSHLVMSLGSIMTVTSPFSGVVQEGV